MKATDVVGWVLFIAAAAVVIAACADIGFARQERYERAALEWEAR